MRGKQFNKAGWRRGIRARRHKPISNLQSLILISLFGLLSLIPTGLSAHTGGTLVLSDQPAGPYRLFAWVQPEPLQVGDVHLSVMVVKAPADAAQPSALDQPVTDVQVTANFEPVSEPDQAITASLPAQTGLGGFFYEADVVLPSVDLWRVTIDVTGPGGTGSAAFERQVLAGRRVNWLVIGGAGLALVALIGLMGAWNRLQAKE